MGWKYTRRASWMLFRVSFGTFEPDSLPTHHRGSIFTGLSVLAGLTFPLPLMTVQPDRRKKKGWFVFEHPSSPHFEGLEFTAPKRAAPPTARSSVGRFPGYLLSPLFSRYNSRPLAGQSVWSWLKSSLEFERGEHGGKGYGWSWPTKVDRHCHKANWKTHRPYPAGSHDRSHCRQRPSFSTRENSCLFSLNNSDFGFYAPPETISHRKAIRSQLVPSTSLLFRARRPLVDLPILSVPTIKS